MESAGIYKIQSKRKPDRIYVGSSNNLGKRWYFHLLLLKRNKHHSIKLQRHFNKYGIEDLEYSILLECDFNKEDLLSKEQFFIDALNPYFNICKVAGSSLGRPSTRKGIKGQWHRTNGCFKKGNIPWSKGRKYHIKGEKRKLSEEQKEKIRKSMMGKKNAQRKAA